MYDIFKKNIIRTYWGRGNAKNKIFKKNIF